MKYVEDLHNDLLNTNLMFMDEIGGFFEIWYQFRVHPIEILYEMTCRNLYWKPETQTTLILL